MIKLIKSQIGEHLYNLLDFLCNNFSNRYLRDRKEAQEKEQKIKAEALHPDCPEGHVPIPDHERKETLRLLKKSGYNMYIYKI